MRLAFRTLLAGLLVFGAAMVATPDDADARGGFRTSSRSYKPRIRAKTAMPKVRSKTYTLGNQKIQGYKNYVKARRDAKLASGGYRLRSNGTVVQRTWTVRTGTVPIRTVPARTVIVTKPVLGQCNDGFSVTIGLVDVICRQHGGVSWNGQTPRITGVRNY